MFCYYRRSPTTERWNFRSGATLPHGPGRITEATMNLAQMLKASFVLLEAQWPADQSRKLVRDLPEASVTHVIVHGGDPGAGAEYYGLFPRKEALDLLSLGGTVREALDLREENATPVLDAALSLTEAPDR